MCALVLYEARRVAGGVKKEILERGSKREWCRRFGESTLSVEGLSNPNIKTEVRREHAQTLDAAVRVARTAKISLEDSHKEVDGGLAAAEVGSRRFAPGEKLSISERQWLFRQGRCGEEDKFDECCFSVEEGLRTLEPEDPEWGRLRRINFGRKRKQMVDFQLGV